MPYVVLPIKAISRTKSNHRSLSLSWEDAVNGDWRSLFSRYDKKWYLKKFFPEITDEDLPKWGRQDTKPEESIPEGGTLRYFPTYGEMDLMRDRERGKPPLPWDTDDYRAELSVPWSGADMGTPWTPSLTDEGQVRFYPDWIRCIEDRPEVVTVGRFLRIMWEYFDDTLDGYATRNWGELTDARVQQWTTMPKPQSVEDLIFADTPDEIERIYLNGPPSCMSHAANNYTSGHPTRAYAGHGLAVAALPKRADPKKKFSQRALVWPAKKVYSTIYGTGKLEELLKELGYTKGSFHGARLAKIIDPARDSMVMPWIDDQVLVLDMGKYLKIHSKIEIMDGIPVADLALSTRRPAWSARVTANGAVTYMHRCATCGKARKESYWQGGKPLCKSCYDAAATPAPVEQYRCHCGSARKPDDQWPYIYVTRQDVGLVRRRSANSYAHGRFGACCGIDRAKRITNDGYVIMKNPLYKEPNAEPQNTAHDAPVQATNGVTDGAELS